MRGSVQAAGCLNGAALGGLLLLVSICARDVALHRNGKYQQS